MTQLETIVHEVSIFFQEIKVKALEIWIKILSGKDGK